jgi:hypothetical protein
LPYTYGISLGYAGVGGDLTTEEFSFNVISGNTLSRAISRHNLATNISVVTLDPYITLFPLSGAPLGITAGVSAGAFVAKTFTQSQEIIEPTCNGSLSLVFTRPLLIHRAFSKRGKPVFQG